MTKWTQEIYNLSCKRWSKTSIGRPPQRYNTHEKIRNVLESLRGEDSIAELCRREGIAQGVYYKWSEPKVAIGLRLHGGWQAQAVLHKPRLLSDNGPSYVAGELADYLADKI